MNAVEISLEIFNEIEKALNEGYGRLFMNVDDQCNGLGFLRVLAMNGPEDMIVYEGTFELKVCYQILDLLEQSKYDIKDFTTRFDD